MPHGNASFSPLCTLGPKNVRLKLLSLPDFACPDVRDNCLVDRFPSQLVGSSIDIETTNERSERALICEFGATVWVGSRAKTDLEDHSMSNLSMAGRQQR